MIEDVSAPARRKKIQYLSNSLGEDTGNSDFNRLTGFDYWSWVETLSVGENSDSLNYLVRDWNGNIGVYALLEISHPGMSEKEWEHDREYFGPFWRNLQSEEESWHRVMEAVRGTNIPAVTFWLGRGCGIFGRHEVGVWLPRTWRERDENPEWRVRRSFRSLMWFKAALYRDEQSGGGVGDGGREK